MPRANTTCSIDGCHKTSVAKTGRCKIHKRPPWEGSKRNLSRPGNWRTTRQLVLARDGHLCVTCGAAATDVDHIIPIALGGSWSPSNLQSLCGACHMLKTLEEAAQRRARGKP